MEPLATNAADYPLVVIVGPTASGKSALGIEVALRFGGEIVNCDSVQVYRGFDIGAGKVAPESRQGVPHHLLDIVEPDEVFTAGDFRREASRALDSVRERGRLPILVGGTGLYLRALLLGLFDGPRRSEELRARLKSLTARHGGERLHRLLWRLDPTAAGRIHARDTQKTIRAVEVCLVARRPMSAMLGNGRTGLPGFRFHKIGLDPDRAALCDRINRRVEFMVESGWLEEVRALAVRPDASKLKPLGALGYRQLAAALRGEISLDEAVRATQAVTRQYAKRQMTWFRREPGIMWFAGFGDDPEIQGRALEWLRAGGPAAGNSAGEKAVLVG
ncbi:MAG TPA: tRNA (adenosine(37)-N6)-dimethylallyltransferase MiaA [Terriglobia bacterium]|nr:tRNA (adenosine(37)-N6)-dimethylallyltransferase MiaA [Terriglobia bacterium]